MIYILFFIFCLALLGIGIYLITKANKIKITKHAEQEQLDNQCKIILQRIQQLSNDKTQLELVINQKKTEIDDLYEKEKNRLSEQLKIYKENTLNATEKYCEQLEEVYNTEEQKYNNKIQKLKEEQENAAAALKKVQNSLNAATEAELREREKEENLQFYKLSLSPLDEEDILRLESIKLSLHQPVILSKLIWSTYFQKQTTELCNRVLGTKTVCGIYKITDLKTKQCYIGQSVKIGA